MIFDLETHLIDLVNTLKKDIPKDADGMAKSGFWRTFNFKNNSGNFAQALYWMFDDLYAGKLLGFVKPGVEFDEEEWQCYTSLGSGPLTEEGRFEEIPSWVEGLTQLAKIAEMYPLLEACVTPKCMGYLENCLRLAWAIIRQSDAHDEGVFVRHVKAINHLCHQALMDAMSPEVAVTLCEAEQQEVQVTPSERVQEMLEKCLKILGPRPKSGKRSGTYTIDGVSGKTMDEVFEHVINSVKWLSGGKWKPSGLRKRFYTWESKQLKQKKKRK